MWAGMLDISRNPISLVQNTGATRRVRKARSLTAEQFQALLKELHEPFATMALLCVCLGLRISEALALRWADVDWLDSRLSVRRGIVEQVVADVKTEGSARTFSLTSELLERLKSCKQRSDFSGDEDWIFASPIKLGRLPYSYTGVWRELVRAAEAAKFAAAFDAATARQLGLERALQGRFGGGCQLAFAAHATADTLYVFHERTGPRVLPITSADFDQPVAAAERIWKVLGL